MARLHFFACLTSPTGADFDQLCHALSNNDPNKSTVSVYQLNNDRAYRLGESLKDNTKVAGMRLDISHLTANGNWGSLPDFIQSSWALSNVSVFGVNGDVSASAVVVGRFLRAMARSPTIQELILIDAAISVESIAVLLQSMRTLGKLHLLGCQMEASNGYSALELAAAFSENVTLESMKIRYAWMRFSWLQ